MVVPIGDDRCFGQPVARSPTSFSFHFTAAGYFPSFPPSYKTSFWSERSDCWSYNITVGGNDRSSGLPRNEFTCRPIGSQMMVIDDAASRSTAELSTHLQAPKPRHMWPRAKLSSVSLRHQGSGIPNRKPLDQDKKMSSD